MKRKNKTFKGTLRVVTENDLSDSQTDFVSSVYPGTLGITTIIYPNVRLVEVGCFPESAEISGLVSPQELHDKTLQFYDFVKVYYVFCCQFLFFIIQSHF